MIVAFPWIAFIRNKKKTNRRRLHRHRRDRHPRDRPDRNRTRCSQLPKRTRTSLTKRHKDAALFTSASSMSSSSSSGISPSTSFSLSVNFFLPVSKRDSLERGFRTNTKTNLSVCLHRHSHRSRCSHPASPRRLRRLPLHCHPVLPRTKQSQTNRRRACRSLSLRLPR